MDADGIPLAFDIFPGNQNEQTTLKPLESKIQMKKTSVTSDGEIAEKQVYGLDEEQIQKEEMYDGFYAVITNLEGDTEEIIKINRQRWEIEENFRIMKTD